MKPILAWHFLTEEYVPTYGRRKKPLYVGHLWKMKGPIEICERGLHGSILPLDALSYAYGSIVTRTAHSGTVIHGKDKLVSTRRKILGMADATTVLHEFACDVIEKVMHQYSITDERCWAAVELKRRWIRGEAADEELGATYRMAWDAAREASQSPMRVAALDVVRATCPSTACRDAKHAVDVINRENYRGELNTDLESRLLRLLGMEEV